jgi:hypothetical protein
MATQDQKRKGWRKREHREGKKKKKKNLNRPVKNNFLFG